MYGLKVSKFQNEFMKSSFLLNYDPNIVRIHELPTLSLRSLYYGNDNIYEFLLLFQPRYM